jgi:dTDP-4-amino-4,6-dideoxygalactose transaminase
MINVTKTFLPNKEKYLAYVDRIFSAGWITNNGQFVQELERRLAEYLGVRNLLLLTNGTLPLQVAYKILGLKGEAITTPFTFVATTSALVWEGIEAVFSDIDPDTLNMDPEKIEAKVTSKTSAIVPVHVYGNACEVEKIQAVATRNGLKVIYDAAHAFGVKYKGQSILNFGDVSTLSFHATKLFHSVEGGAIIVNDDELFKKAKLAINFGITGPESIQGLGINCKMSEFHAAMGLCVLDEVEAIFVKRKRVFDYYIAHLPAAVRQLRQNPESTRNYSYFPVLFESEKALLKVQASLSANGVGTRRYFYPSLETLDFVRPNQQVPIANDTSRRILCLPMYDSLDEKILEKICTLVTQSLVF